MYKLLVFDLDFTLWDAGGTWCDHTYAPHTKKNGEVYDAYGSRIRLYNDVMVMLEQLKNDNYKIAIASRTGSPETAQKLIDLFEIDHFFDFKEIYPASKLNHFRELKSISGFSYNEMIFFDDETRNIEEVSSIGVKSVFVRNGITLELVNKALK